MPVSVRFPVHGSPAQVVPRPGSHVGALRDQGEVRFGGGHRGRGGSDPLPLSGKKKELLSACMM